MQVSSLTPLILRYMKYLYIRFTNADKMLELQQKSEEKTEICSKRDRLIHIS